MKTPIILSVLIFSLLIFTVFNQEAFANAERDTLPTPEIAWMTILESEYEDKEDVFIIYFKYDGVRGPWHYDSGINVESKTQNGEWKSCGETDPLWQEQFVGTHCDLDSKYFKMQMFTSAAKSEWSDEAPLRGPIVTVNTDKTTYNPDDTVTVIVSGIVDNSIPIQIGLEIEHENKRVDIYFVSVKDNEKFSHTFTLSYPIQGEYTVTATYFDHYSGQTTFNIGEKPTVDSITTDKKVYRVGDTIKVSGFLFNETPGKYTLGLHLFFGNNQFSGTTKIMYATITNDDGTFTKNIETIDPLNVFDEFGEYSLYINFTKDNGVQVKAFTVFTYTDEVCEFGEDSDGYCLDDPNTNAVSNLSTVDTKKKKGGGGCADCEPPTLGLNKDFKRVVDYGFGYNGNMVQVMPWYTEFPLIEVNVGEENLLEVKVYENNSVNNMKLIQACFGTAERGDALEKCEVLIEVYLKTNGTIDWIGLEKMIVIDKDHLLSKVSVTAYTVLCQEPDKTMICTKLDLLHTFAEAPINKMVTIQVVDKPLNPQNFYFNDGITVLGESLNDPLTITLFEKPTSQSIINNWNTYTRTDKVNNIWTDQYHIEYEKVNDSFVRITPQEPMTCVTPDVLPMNGGTRMDCWWRASMMPHYWTN